MKRKINIYNIFKKASRFLYRITLSVAVKRSLRYCGKNVIIPHSCIFAGIENVSIGDSVALSDNMTILTTRASVIIGDSTMFGPNVTIITGNHEIDIVGRTMISIRDDEKNDDSDQDIILEGDNWIGANSVILKGVTIGRGAVVAAGSVVTHDVKPYCVYGGIPAKFIRSRFSDADLERHIRLLNFKKEEINCEG